VFGAYPPIPGHASEATLGEVRRLLAGGADVRVVSPVPSAAHHDADLHRPAGALRFARTAVGAELLVLHLDGELLTSKAHRDALPARLAVAAALRSAGHSTVHLPPAVPVPAAWSRALAAADEVVTPAGLAGGGGVTGVGPALAGATAPAGEGAESAVAARPAWDLPPEPTREEVEAQIQRRAAERRAGRRAAVAAGAGHRQASRTLRAMPLLGPDPPHSSRLPAAVVKQVVSRLVDWRINPVIEHVNLLHRAVLDAVDRDPEPETGEVDGG
jgi:hypothetical protein